MESKSKDEIKGNLISDDLDTIASPKEEEEIKATENLIKSNNFEKVEAKSNSDDPDKDIKNCDTIDDLISYNFRKIKRKIIVEEDDKDEVLPKKRKKVTNKKETAKKDTNETYCCNVCGVMCLSEYHFNTHRNTHAKDSEYTCEICHDTFDTNDILLKHKRTHENDDNLFLCKACKKAFSDHRMYICHRINHLKKPPFKCYECNYQFTRKFSFKSHIYLHYNIESTCTICNKTMSYTKMRSHIAGHNVIECVECGKRIKSKSMYRYHMAVHTGVKKFQCWYCGQGFISTCQRMIHTRIHTGERPFKCSQCSRTFKQRVDLIRHESRHKKEEYYECDHCGKRYASKQSVITHLRLHNNYKPYKCPFCAERFHTSTYLTLHTYKTHLKEDQFKCDMCNRSFKMKNDYRRHLMTKEHQQMAYKHIING